MIRDQPSLLLDGAHNPAAAEALREFLEEFVRVPLTLIFGAMKDKKLDEIALILFPVADRLILTRPDNARAATLDDLQRLAANIIDPKSLFVEPSASEALRKAKEITPAKGLIAVTGSLYLVGEILRSLGQIQNWEP